MRLATPLALLAAATLCLVASPVVSVRGDVDWPNLTSSELGALAPSDIAGATALNFNSLQPDACMGWTGALLAAAATVAPFTQCSGFTVECISEMPANVFSSLNAACFGGLTAYACSGIIQQQAYQLAAGACAAMTVQCAQQLNTDTMGGLTAACMSVVPAGAIGVWTPNQIASIDSVAFGTIASAGIAAIQPLSCAGITALQTANLGTGTNATDACSGFTAWCLSNVTMLAVPSFQPGCISRIAPTVFAALNVQQVGGLTNQAIGGVQAPQLIQLYQANTGTFLDGLWSVDQANALANATMVGWNTFVDQAAADARPQQAWSANTIWNQQSQLQLSSCTPDCMAALFGAAANPNRLPALTWNGMRPTLVQAVGPAASAAASVAMSKLALLRSVVGAPPIVSVVGNISFLTTQGSWAQWPLHATQALSAAQVAQLPSDTIQTVGPASLSVDGVRGLTASDIRAISAAAWLATPCATYDGLTADQLDTLKQQYPDVAATLVQRCAFIIFSSTGPQPSNGTSSPDADDEMSTGNLVGVTIGCVLGVGLTVFGFIWLIRFHQKHARGESHSLGTHLFATDAALKTVAQNQKAYAEANDPDQPTARPYAQLDHGVQTNTEERKER